MKTDKNTHQTPSGHPSQTELASSDNNQQYLVLAPDGDLASYDFFQGKKEAEEFIPIYCQKFAEQGCYNAKGLNIPLEELPKHMVIVSAIDYFGVFTDDDKSFEEKFESFLMQFWWKWGPFITVASLLMAIECLFWIWRIRSFYHN